MKFNFKTVIALVLITVLTSVIGAQENADNKTSDGKVAVNQTDPGSEYSEADRPEENYLARFHALDTCTKLEKRNLDNIYILNVITQNFKAENSGWEEDYKTVYEGYKSAMDLYYRRNVIYAAERLRYNNKQINDFYEKISDKYRSDCLEILSLCASNILELTLDSRTKSDPNKNRILFDNKSRLRIAYQNLDDAERARLDQNYSLSLFNYRITKKYAIDILESLDPEQYKNKYDKHKADNRNRIWVDKKTTAPEFQSDTKTN
ncbi:MAG: hypothetical protein JW982_10805 [Spirochaetes bacterium]|nr:hypothetical protein [Spirochaetota bacterium]